jgi:hypothetical protein
MTPLDFVWVGLGGHAGVNGTAFWNLHDSAFFIFRDLIEPMVLTRKRNGRRIGRFHDTRDIRSSSHIATAGDDRQPAARCPVERWICFFRQARFVWKEFGLGNERQN